MFTLIVQYNSHFVNRKNDNMEKEKIILHSDLNNFYASVECILHPELAGRFVAVCGNQEERHGIVLAKNGKAKAMGVKTGEAIWEARKKCPELIVVPPTFDQYAKYSKIVQQIYSRYTNQIEPFGMDECWLDVTGSTRLFGSGVNIAHQIRRAVKEETGLTVSVGVSFNKIFAKLGSDMKKPDAVTVITPQNYKNVVWPLKANELLGVGRATYKKLTACGIFTIGDIACSPPDFLQQKLGKCGIMLHNYANGLECESVSLQDYVQTAKSIGHGTTCTEDLHTDTEVKNVILYLLQEVSHRLRQVGAKASGIAITIKYPNLEAHDCQCPLPYPTVSMRQMCKTAMELVCANRKKNVPVRAVTVRAINLMYDCYGSQTSLFDDPQALEKEEKAEDTMELINNRFGASAVKYASVLANTKIPKNEKKELFLPKGTNI